VNHVAKVVQPRMHAAGRGPGSPPFKASGANVCGRLCPSQSGPSRMLHEKERWPASGSGKRAVAGRS